MRIVPPARRRIGFCSWRSGPERASLCLVASLLLTLVLTGCPAKRSEPPPNPTPAERSAGAFAGTDPWRLTTSDPDAARGNRGIFLGNGYLGATFGPDGVAGPNSVCYVAGVYDARENLAPIPTWNTLDLPKSWSRRTLTQTLDIQRGVLVSSDGRAEVSSFVSAANPHLAVQRLKRSDAARGGSPPRVRVAMTEVAQAVGAALHVATAVAEQEPAGQDTLVRLVAVATSRETPDPWAFARRTVEEASRLGFDALLRRHEAVWAKRWKRDIVIEGDPEAQQLVHKLMFDLLQSVRAGGADAIPPETWSGDFYKGHIFWDADVWMFPALLAQHPDLARGLLDYRFRHLDEARRRAKSAGFAGADFPWESAATGRETAPGGFQTGRHVTAGVGWAHWQYWLATGDRTWLRARGWPVLSGVADYFASRAVKNAATGKFDLRGVFGPDEVKGAVDNNTYTNALARTCLRAAGAAAKLVGRPANPKWATVAANIALPFDRRNDRYLARENDRGERTKQADGELVLYPAGLPMSAKTAGNTFDFHHERPIQNGPAMTASIHALIAARLGRGAEAERFFRDSYRPFVRGPFLLFSEKRSLDRCVFATGAGGVLQSVIYGFGGLDWETFDAKRFPVALPASWKRLRITGIQRGGKTYTLEVTPGKRTLTPQ